ncbi:MAG TPA: GNAT family N-acetyltransferase [Chitinispirillaceae bacterium]|nr:GNAT family N-acetyltransferase [Chitinispirillaceae bacterium]
MIQIRHATISEKEKTYNWLCLSDTTSMHMGEPDYPESPIPDWQQFQDDFEDFYYLESGRDKGSVMIIENDGEEIGCLCYARFHLKPYRAELDIWFKAKVYCGKGYGPQALQRLIKYLTEKQNVKKFLIRPSEKNLRAIAAYEKAGFIRAANKESAIDEFLNKKFTDEYGAGDYGFENTAVLTLEQYIA